MRRLGFVVLTMSVLTVGSFAWFSPVPTPSLLPDTVKLLFIEEINTHLLRPLADQVPVAQPIQLDLDDRQVRLVRVDDHRQGMGPHLLAAFHLYDHDYLAAARVFLLPSSRLPAHISVPWSDGGYRLFPDALTINELHPNESMALMVERQRVQLQPGETWSAVRTAGRSDLLSLAGDGTGAGNARSEVESALDQGVPVSVLRLRHLGTWSVADGRHGP